MDYARRIVTFIVPVYNGFTVFSELLESLGRVYTTSDSHVKFIFMDDASPDPQIAKLFLENSFINAEGVQKHTNPKNLGFIGTVNRAIALSDPESDIILLNSDTQIFSDIAQEMQKVALSDPKIGTVTPLTNSGTIASLFAYPDGGNIPVGFSAREIADLVQTLNIPAPTISAPTGVGFAMYITRNMLNSVGVLDPIFGKGYGEECDLCQRGILAGYTHLIATNCFVFHKGSESFSTEVRNTLVEANGKTLLKRHRNYDNDVQAYIKENPLALSRATLLTEILLSKCEAKKGIIYVLHSALEGPQVGGTEKHVEWLTESLEDQLSVVLSPDIKKKTYVLELRYKDFSFREELEELEANCYLNHYLTIFTTTHLHHYMDLSEDILFTILNISRKLIVTVHDFYFICPTVNLLTTPEKNVFCGAETNPEICNNCLRSYYLKKERIGLFREKAAHVLSIASKIIFPSDSARSYTEKIYPFIKSKSVTMNHDLGHYPRLDYVQSPKERDTIVFLGGIGKHKGADLLIEASHTITNFANMEVWGSIHDPAHKMSKKVEVKGYSNPGQLFNLFKEIQPAYVVIPSIWAETFCYTFYETILMSHAVPIVFSLGNPANVVQSYHCGVIYRTNTVAALLAATEEARTKRGSLIKNIDAYRELILTVPTFSVLYKDVVGSRDLELAKLTAPEANQIKFISSIPLKKIDLAKISVDFLKKQVSKNQYIFKFTYRLYSFARKVLRKLVKPKRFPGPDTLNKSQV